MSVFLEVLEGFWRRRVCIPSLGFHGVVRKELLDRGIVQASHEFPYIKTLLFSLLQRYLALESCGLDAFIDQYLGSGSGFRFRISLSFITDVAEPQ